MRGRWLAAAGLATLMLGGAARAQDTAPASGPAAAEADDGTVDTLREALVQTYASNPTLMAERANLRATDEGVAIARGTGRPTISGTAGFNQDLVTHNTGGTNGRNFVGSVDLSLPIYSGGAVRNGVHAANSRVDAGRADLRATEGDVFTDAVAAYMDVIRDRSIVQLNENQVRVLETNLQANRDRFEVGDLTRTDVAQSEARLSLARSQLLVARGRLEATEENYRRVIGVTAADLQPPPPLPPLPASADAAEDLALANNPDLASIAAQARAADYDVDVARAARLPTVSATGSTSYYNALGRADEAAGLPEGTLPNTTTTSGIGVSVRIPIYQGGVAGARVRRSEALRSQLLELSVATERLVVSNTRSAFASYRAAQDAIASNEIAVAANQLALEGTRAEQTVGTRNVLDVLNAEQELLNSQVLLVTARRDAYVAGFQLLNAMGQAEAEDLNLDGGALYDPQAHYRQHAGSWSDWSEEHDRAPVSTRTVAPDANSPVTELPH